MKNSAEFFLLSQNMDVIEKIGLWLFDAFKLRAAEITIASLYFCI